MRTYGDVAFLTLGNGGKLVVDVFLVLTQLGFSAAYFIFVSDNLHQVVDSADGPTQREWLDNWICAPLSHLRSVSGC